MQGTEVSVGISLGIAVFPDDGEDPETLMKHADAAMYRSKREGRNRYQFFSKSVDQAASARLRLEADIRRGLAEGQFVAHYQPIIDAVSGAPVALEALARWNRPEQGVQGPFVFITVAEESGLIVALGAQMLRQACEQLRAWRGSALGQITIAVNVSPVQLAAGGFVEMVAETLRSTGVVGTQLAFEITESTLMHDPDATLHILRQIKSLGIRIAVDDFGTGYSSLSHLKRFPVDSVKIDRVLRARSRNRPRRPRTRQGDRRDVAQPAAACGGRGRRDRGPGQHARCDGMHVAARVPLRPAHRCRGRDRLVAHGSREPDST